MTGRPSPDEVIAMARVAHIPIDQAIAERIVRSIGPALEGFAPVATNLPFDIEPSTFVAEQLKGSNV